MTDLCKRFGLDVDGAINQLLDYKNSPAKQNLNSREIKLTGFPRGQSSSDLLYSATKTEKDGGSRSTFMGNSTLLSADIIHFTMLPAQRHLVQLPEGTIRLLCQVSREVFMQEGMLLELSAPMNIFGDIHGQYDDLLRHFENLGYPPDVACLFMGDYVDRGKKSLETICLLLAYKIKYPNNMFLLRGNHESASINRIYGFYDECKRRYNIKLWKTFTDCFNCLPIAAVVEKTIFCCHGGLSPDLHDLDQLRSLERPMDVPDKGLVCDLLWSDPDEDITGWGDNDRGVSWTFGGDVVRAFLKKHDLSLVARAHQVVEDGYRFFEKRKLVTLFSAPNYCGEFDNAGGVLIVSKNLMCSLSILKPDSLTINIKETPTEKKSGRFGRSSNQIQVQ